MMASRGPLHGKESVWADLTSVRFESSYKLPSLDRDELNTLRSVYVTMYPKVTNASLAMATIYKKYNSLSVGVERYGSTAGSRLCPYARIIASWCGTMESLTMGLCDLELFIILWFTVSKSRESRLFTLLQL